CRVRRDLTTTAMPNPLASLLSELGIRPILVDVGASGSPPTIWRQIAEQSIYVGFDPDLREIRELSETDFHKAVMVNEAITTPDGAGEQLFYFTKSPYCSSTLKPDAASLSAFLFAHLFAVDREGMVRTSTLDRVADAMPLCSLDWIKIDTQGT